MSRIRALLIGTPLVFVPILAFVLFPVAFFGALLVLCLLYISYVVGEALLGDPDPDGDDWV